MTEFGRRVVEDVVKRGMVPDLAHSSPQVVRDVLEIADSPLVVSHTGVRARCDAKSNFPDTLMRRIVASGGTIGIGYCADVACAGHPPAGIARMIRTAIEVVGEDHVSPKSDSDGSVATALDASELRASAYALPQQGSSEANIRKVLGANMVRVQRARLG